ncbi:hypothetical protein EC9_12060 [Rosistilla ulvae]|uniref:Uncharacterized protein n=1 Tax=Rosistilla ulvae TaxID=1930277 RepID=A0A517LWP7_9BACT|nr:hypothetical protein EC9_12060 [Rosistilla ulvae]
MSFAFRRSSRKLGHHLPQQHTGESCATLSACVSGFRSHVLDWLQRHRRHRAVEVRPPWDVPLRHPPYTDPRSVTMFGAVAVWGAVLPVAAPSADVGCSADLILSGFVVSSMKCSGASSFADLAAVATLLPGGGARPRASRSSLWSFGDESPAGRILWRSSRASLPCVSF